MMESLIDLHFFFFTRVLPFFFSDDCFSVSTFLLFHLKFLEFFFRVFFFSFLSTPPFTLPRIIVLFLSTQFMPGTYIGVEGKCKPPMYELCSCVTGSSVSPVVLPYSLALHGIVSSCNHVYVTRYYLSRCQ